MHSQTCSVDEDDKEDKLEDEILDSEDKLDKLMELNELLMLLEESLDKDELLILLTEKLVLDRLLNELDMDVLVKLLEELNS